MSNFKNVLRIPHFLRADTPIELQKLMLKQNIEKDRPFEYFSIQFTGSEWVAWYYEDVQGSTKKGVTQ